MMVGYAGSRGYNLVTSIEANPAVPVVQSDGRLFFPAGAPRRNPAWGSIDYRTSHGHSTYNSLQTSLMRRFAGDYQIQFSYTLSKTMDNNDAQLGQDTLNTSTFPPNPYDPDAEWAVAPFDSPHVFAANATWELPTFRSNPVLGGWQLNAVVSLRSGYPFSPSIATPNWSRSGNVAGGTEDRPDVKPGTDPKKIVTGDPNRWFDTSVFEMQPRGYFGNTPRSFLRGPGFCQHGPVARQEPGAGWRHARPVPARDVQSLQSPQLQCAEPPGLCGRGRQRDAAGYRGTGDTHRQYRAADPAGGEVDLLNRNA